MNAFQEINVHNMTKVQALTAIDAALRRANAGAYRIRARCCGTRCGHIMQSIPRSGASSWA